MKKITSMLIRVGLLLIMVGAGFLAFFPEFWELRDFQKAEQIKQSQNAAKTKRTADFKTQRAHKRALLFSLNQFPDDNFLRCVIAQNKDRPEQITSLDCSNQNISDTSGIAQLTGLRRLNLSNNNVVKLDLTKNTKLNDVIATNNSIHDVQLPVEYLQTVDLSNNNLATFDLHDTPRLQSIDLRKNKLDTITLTTSSIKHLWADNNALNSMALGHLPELEVLSLRNNQLTTLNWNEVPQLKYIDLSANPLHTINLDHLKKLKAVLLNNTELTPQKIEKLRQGPAMINTMSVSESDYPDPVFRHCVEAHLIDGFSSLNKISCDRNKIGLLTRNMPIKNVEGIENLYALKELDLAFHKIDAINTANLLRLEKLHINGNKLQQLDLRTNSKLVFLQAANNHLNKIQLQGNTQLESLYVSSNKLQSLDLTQIPNIRALQLNDNRISSLDSSNNKKLKRLLIDNNQLSHLDISNLRFPTQLSLRNNPLDAASIDRLRPIYWAEHTNLTDEKILLKRPKLPVFSLAEKNFPDALFKKCIEQTFRRKQLNALDELKRLDCSYKDITNLAGIQLLTALESLILQGIDATHVPLSNLSRLNNLLLTELPIESLDLSQLPQLKTVHISRNRYLRELLLAENNSIERLTADHNAITSLFIPNGKNLKWLNLANNQLEKISFGQLNNLIKLDVNNNQLKQINVKRLTALQDLMVIKNNLIKIDLRLNQQLQELYLATNQIDVLDLTNNTQLKEVMLFDNPLKVPDLAHLNMLKDLAVDQTQFDDMVDRKMHSIFNPKTKALGPAIILTKQTEMMPKE